MNSNTVIIVQGSSSNVKEQKEAWKSQDVLFSTWKGCEEFYTNDDLVIFNDVPSDPGPINFWFQQASTFHGIKKAKEMGYTHCLKIRSDLVPTNSEKFLQLMDKESLNFLCWHNHEVYPNCPGYLVDYLMFGPIDQMINLWDIETAFCVVPEIMLTWNYIKKCEFFPLKYFFSELNQSNDLYWIKRNIWLSSYTNKPIYDVHKKFYFSDEKSNLQQSYLNFLASGDRT